MEEERKLILTMVAEGKITPEEADALLTALEEEEAAEDLRASQAAQGTPGPSGAPSPPPQEEPRSYLQEILGSDLSTLGSTLESVMERVRDELKQVPDQLSRLGLDKRAWVWGWTSHPFVVEFHSRQQWTAGPVHVVNAKGDVHVETWDQAAVDVGADLVAGGDLTDEVRRALAEEGVTLEHRGDALYVRALDALRRKYPGVRLGSATMRLKVPRGCSLDISAIRGDVDVSGDPGEVRAEAVHGDLNIRGGAGRLRASTRNGDIDVERFRGEEAEIDSTNGDITLKVAAGAVKASAVRGDVNVDVDQARQVRVDTVSGDVSASVRLAPAATCEVHTVRGDVDLRLQPSGGLQVALETTSGDLSCQLPLDQVQKGRGSLKGSRGDGASLIHVSSMHGDLTVR
ncbi:MAG: DUF4097 family beta strand repeat-containing protein [Bacillota bacterium]